jgi:hypothetical protein
MEFNRLFNIFTISAIVIMLLTVFASAVVAVKERSEINLGDRTAVSVSVNHTINGLTF